MPGQMYVPFAVGMRPDKMGPARCVYARGPVQLLHKRGGVEEFAIGAVENIKKSVAVGLHQQPTGRAVIFDIDKHRRFIGVIVIEVVRRELEVPFQLPGVGIDRQHARGVKIVAGTRISRKSGAALLVVQ